MCVCVCVCLCVCACVCVFVDAHAHRPLLIFILCPAAIALRNSTAHLTTTTQSRTALIVCKHLFWGLWFWITGTNAVHVTTHLGSSRQCVSHANTDGRRECIECTPACSYVQPLFSFSPFFCSPPRSHRRRWRGLEAEKLLVN